MRLAARESGFSYKAVTLIFLGLSLASLIPADLHIAALHPWAEMARLGMGFVAPDFAAVGLKAVILTVAFAVLGVGLGAAAGVLLCLFFASHRLVRILAGALRSIHELFWALILIQITGLSPLTGILAVAIPYAGIFAKVYAEIIEEADLAAERALPHGTGRIARFAYVRVPPLADAFKSYTLYRLECGLRSTLVLGFVGLPTIGFDLESYFAEGHYPEAAALILVFYILIASRGLWARVATLPFLIPGSIVAIWGLTDHFGAPSIAANLARFGLAIVPAPLHQSGGWTRLPDWLWQRCRDEVLPGIATTLVLSQLAIALAAVAALVLFPAVSRRFTGPAGRIAGRALLIFFRGTPDYVLAYILLQLAGPSMLPAVLALGFHNGGILAFLMGRHADGLSGRRDTPRGLDLYAYEIMPRLYGQFIALVLYRWEIILRESAIVGLLGVRTLGFHIDAAISETRLDRAAILLVATAGLSISVDFLSRGIRWRLHITAVPARLGSGREVIRANEYG